MLYLFKHLKLFKTCLSTIGACILLADFEENDCMTNDYRTHIYYYPFYEMRPLCPHQKDVNWKELLYSGDYTISRWSPVIKGMYFKMAGRDYDCNLRS